MYSSSDLQDAVARELETPGKLPLSAPVIRRKEKDVENDMRAGNAAQQGLCIYCMPPLPTSALQNVPFVFFDGYEIRVRIIELPAMNITGVDAYSLIDRVATALQWNLLGGLLSYPLQLSERPVEMLEGVLSVPGFEKNEDFLRVIDVIFNAVLQVNPEPDTEQ